MIPSTSDSLSWFKQDVTSWNWLTGGTILATVVGSLFLVLGNRKKRRELESQIQDLSISIGVNLIIF